MRIEIQDGLQTMDPIMRQTSERVESNQRILLLFTTTGYNAQDFVAAAKKLGIEVVAGTDRCHMLEDPWRDGALPLRFGNPQKSAEHIVQYARQKPVSAIIAVGDKPTLTAALACRALGLPCNSVEAVAACRNKITARQLFQKAGLPVPEFSSYPIDSDGSRIATKVRYPCVLKPLSLSASQGVIRADSPDDFAKGFRRIARLLKTPEIRATREKTLNRILVEDYIEGQELALEGMLEKGRLKVLALFDKPDPMHGPFFEETIYITPSCVDPEIQEQIHRRCEQAAEAVGLLQGPIHVEIRVNSRGVWIVEIAARSIGGLCSRTLRFGTGMSLEELIIRQALAMNIPSYQRRKAAAGVMMIPIPKAGFLHEVEGVEKAWALEGIQEVTITAKLGQKLVPLPEGASYLGFIFAIGASPLAVERLLRSAHGKLRFDITPELPVI
jgi:biotin carboxylase